MFQRMAASRQQQPFHSHRCVTVVILSTGPRGQSGGELDAACVVYGAHVGEVAVRTDKH